MTIKRFWRYWIVVAVLATWLAYDRAAPDAPTLVQPREAARIPPLPDLPPPHDIVGLADELRSSPMWGDISRQSMPLGQQESSPPDWMLVGVYGREKDMRVIVRFSEDREPMQALAVGDLLPSGDEIVAIRSDGICVALGDSQTPRSLPINAVSPQTF